MSLSDNSYRPLRIALASYAPIFSGAEISGSRLARGLMSRGHQVLVLVGARNEEFLEKLKSLDVPHVVSLMQYTDFWTAPRYWLRRRQIRHLLEDFRPDIIHSNDLQTHQIISDASRRLGVPRVSHHRWSFDGPTSDWLNKFGAERHIFISNYLREQMLAQSKTLGNSPCAVVHNGFELPPRPAPEVRRTLRNQLALPQDRLIVLFAGQLVETKGIEDLLRAWSLLPQELRGLAELVIAGDDQQQGGSYRASLLQLSKSLDIAPRFVGFQRNVLEWMTASDMVVVPSHLEPFGLVSMEAMSLCRPVVATRAGGIPEVLADGETGKLVPVRDPQALAHAMAEFLRDPQARHDFGERGRIRCEQHFSIQVYAGNVEQQYRNMLAPQS